ncbi:hypothetical protein EHS25_000811 [Saitozyma podzolica]|uniref:Major facilitator superfamily (MFS) profile domain-containing protein n=1 Tax=Saitozyma podzolica TaxID=1890683 RepID=A0A427YXB2_9TREE|nr:hypothetical protein EHS25_000811 [Saitozyma podzolica]
MEHPHDNVHTGARHETSYRVNQDLLKKAEDVANFDKGMGFRETLRIYRKAAVWSVVLSTALIMEGYDVVIINSFFGQSSFLHRFGQVNAQGQYFIPANWQSALNNAASIGQVIGLLINGYCQDRFGSKKTYLCAMVFMAGAIFLLVFANSLEMLFAGELVCGIPWGIFQTLTTAYAAEICPVALRGYLTSYVNACWGIGLTIGAAVVRGSLVIEGDWGMCILFCVALVSTAARLTDRMAYAVRYTMGVANPTLRGHLVRPGKKDRTDQAKKSLRKLARSDYMDEQTIDAHIALIAHTIELERAETEGGGWKDLFRGTNRRRTEIACVVWSAQYWCGQPISNFATEFLQTAGMGQEGAFDLNVANFVMIFFGTVVAWLFFYRLGRRFMYLMGAISMAALFLVIGILGCLPRSTNTSMGIGVVMIMITFAFGISVAPACYSIVAEIPATRAALQQLFPRFLTAKPDGWDLGGKCGFIFVGTNIILALYCFFRLPETIGRTFGEIDTMFHNKIAARRFKSTIVDEFEADRNKVVNEPSGLDEKDREIQHAELEP